MGVANAGQDDTSHRITVQSVLPACELEDGSSNDTFCLWSDGSGDRVLNYPDGSFYNLDSHEYRVSFACESDAECEAVFGSGGYGTTDGETDD